MTKQKFKVLAWEVFTHLPYSADIAPLDHQILKMFTFLKDHKRHQEQIFVQYEKSYLKIGSSYLKGLSKRQQLLFNRLSAKNKLILFLF